MLATFTPRRTDVEVTPVMSQRKSEMCAPAKNAPMTPPASATASRNREPLRFLPSRLPGMVPGSSFGPGGTLFSAGVTGARCLLSLGLGRGRLPPFVDERTEQEVERHNSSFHLAEI